MTTTGIGDAKMLEDMIKKTFNIGEKIYRFIDLENESKAFLNKKNISNADRLQALKKERDANRLRYTETDKYYYQAIKNLEDIILYDSYKGKQENIFSRVAKLKDLNLLSKIETLLINAEKQSKEPA